VQVRRTRAEERVVRSERFEFVMQSNQNEKKSLNEETIGKEAYARVLPELQALSVDELLLITLDIPSAISTTLGALPEIRALRAEIERQLKEFDFTAFDKLEDYAFALNYAHTKYASATQPADDFEAITVEGTALRDTLLGDARTLARRGLVDGNRLKDVNTVPGYKNLATDLGVLADVLGESWSQIEGKTVVAHAELELAMKLQSRLMRIVGLREQGPAVVAAATDMRVRAFTLLARTYDQARRVVSFLRWDAGDTDKIAPSLYAGRSNGRRKTAETPASTLPTPPAPTPPATNAPANPPPAAPAAGGSAPADPYLS
jgi:hypothetical protein